ncbi:beta strand repeat-containing protein [Rhodanobacter sp. Col0626]|uniref:beta strand repeat-containing protein n=1 Tax=Rhodanobacter sp. Col0626 TaxID=3415679 RepID=UPI003CEB7A41
MNRDNYKHYRSKTLVSAIAAVLALGAAGGATAETLTGQSTYTLTPSHAPNLWTQSASLQGYLDGITNSQYLTGDVTADVTGANILVDASMSGAPVTTNNNALLAATEDSTTGLAGANGAANTVDLSSLGRDGLNEGLGILNGQLFDEASVQSSINGGSIATDLTNYAAGSITQSNNSIKATTSINSASNQASGGLTDSFDGTAAGSIEYKFSATTPTTLTSTGGVSVGNVQTTVDAGAGAQSYAHIADSDISVNDAMAPSIPPPLPGLATLTVGVTANGNAIAASYSGNQSDNRFDATAGTSFSGSVSAINGQTNINTVGFDAGDAASVEDSGISAFLGGALAGALSVSKNNLDASAQGNTATTAIVFAKGIDVHGNSPSAHLTEQANTRGILSGDLVLLNTQRNQATELDSHVGGSSILGTSLHLGDGSAMTMTGNGIDASAGGNQAINQVSADSADFSANSAVGNQQVNQGTSISSAVDGAMIATAVLGDISDVANGGSVSVSSDHIGADANGNQANTTIDLQGSNYDTWDTVDNMSANSATSGLVTTGTAGVAVGNEQSNTGGASISAEVGIGTDAFSTHGGWIGAYYNGGLDGASVTVNDDTVSASAGGNAATTGVMLGGTNGHVNAQMSNGQFNDSVIDAKVEGAQVGVYLGGGSSTTASLTVDGDQLNADASANQASNSVTTDFANEGLGLPSQNNWSTASNVIDTAAETNTNKAELAIASNQKNAGSVTAQATDSFIGVNVGEHPWSGDDLVRGNVTDGAINVSGNSASTSAIANNVGNNLNVGAGNLTPDSGHSDQVASLGNLQENAASVIASASVTGDDVRDLEQIGAFVHGNAEDMDATVNNNGVSAFAGGNIAGNTMTFAGTSYTPAASTAPVGGVGLMTATDMSVSAGFALQNVQVDTGGDATSRTASVDNGNIGLSLTDGALDDRHSIGDSTLTVNNNTVSAEARDNYATNGLYLGAEYQQQNGSTVLVPAPLSSLNTTAALQNVQQSSGDTTSSANSLLGVIAGHYDVTGSTASISSNTVSSLASANTASNQLNVAAGTLSGDSRYVDGSYTYGAASIQPNSGILPQFVLADYGVANTQTMGGTVSASLLDSDNNGTGIGLALGQGNLDGGSVTVSNNVQQALAQANAATDTLSLQGTQIDASASVFNQQDAAGTVSATGGFAADALGFGVQVNGSVGTTTALPITVSGNTMLAQAGFNDATNQIHVTGASTIGGSDADFRAVSRDDGTVYAQADESLLNAQTASGAAIATLKPGMSGIEVMASDTQSTIGNTDAASNLTVTGNQFAAQTSLNNASNSVRVDGAASIAATAAVANQQSAAGSAVSQISNADVGIYNRGLDGAGGVITNAAMTVADNLLSTSASGNSASNAINIQPMALNAAASIATQASIDSNGSQAVADYAVLNMQNNAAAVSAEIAGSSIGVNADAGTIAARGSASQMLNSVGTVTGNQAMASAAGNSASNSIVLASVSNIGMPSASLVSSQVNTASISATVSNVTIGVIAGIGSNSPVTVNNNTISATAAGNSAINHIGIGN